MRVVAAGTGENRARALCLLDQHLDDTNAFLIRQRRIFTGRATRHQKVHTGVDLPPPGHYAVAMCFLPQDEKARAFAVKRLEHFIKVEKQRLVGWRDVPTDTTGLGKAVIERMPVIRMAIVGRNAKLDQDAFERKLLAIRKQTQNPLADLEKIGRAHV